MIRKSRQGDTLAIMELWLNANVEAHSFLPAEYWAGHYDAVKEMLPQAELYVYEDAASNEILGFIGLMDGDIAGIFVRDGARSQGIGKQLLDAAKGVRQSLALHVYQKNARALRFYQREGFAAASEGVDEGTGEKEWIMTWHR
ncbi:MAG TPA: GNAT family N-acetyltransferase [Firmicutes bacterium]|nr:GNAT family N-acetyltransferase [Bacillota bacterium]